MLGPMVVYNPYYRPNWTLEKVRKQREIKWCPKDDPSREITTDKVLHLSPWHVTHVAGYLMFGWQNVFQPGPGWLTALSWLEFLDYRDSEPSFNYVQGAQTKSGQDLLSQMAGLGFAGAILQEYCDVDEILVLPHPTNESKKYYDCECDIDRNGDAIRAAFECKGTSRYPSVADARLSEALDQLGKGDDASARSRKQPDDVDQFYAFSTFVRANHAQSQSVVFCQDPDIDKQFVDFDGAPMQKRLIAHIPAVAWAGFRDTALKLAHITGITDYIYYSGELRAIPDRELRPLRDRVYEDAFVRERKTFAPDLGQVPQFIAPRISLPNSVKVSTGMDADRLLSLFGVRFRGSRSRADVPREDPVESAPEDRFLVSHGPCGTTLVAEGMPPSETE